MVAPRRRGARNLLLTYSRSACLSNFRAPKTERVEGPSKLPEFKQLWVGFFRVKVDLFLVGRGSLGAAAVLTATRNGLRHLTRR